MAYLDNEFNAGEVDTSSQFEAIPVGNYQVIIVSSDVKPTKNGAGRYIKLEMDIISGAFKGKKLWANVNIMNPSKVAEEIAKKFLARLCEAVGVAKLRDTEALHNKPFAVKVKLDKNDPDRNVVADVILDGVEKPAAPAPVRRAPAPRVADAGSGPAWKRKAAKPAPVEPSEDEWTESDEANLPD